MEKYSAPPPGFVPPPPMYSAPYPQPTVTTMVMTLGPDSQRMVCPHCHSDISTRLENESTTKTHLFALLLCLLCLPCGLIPYCMDTCKATTHHCPSCGNYIGQYDN